MLDLLSIQAKWSQVKQTVFLQCEQMASNSLIFEHEHIKKAEQVLLKLLPTLVDRLEQNQLPHAVVSISGITGNGRREIASLVCFYLNEIGFGAHLVSGVNYFHRDPLLNEAERRRVFQTAGIRGMLLANCYSDGRAESLNLLVKNGTDTDPNVITVHPWIAIYQRAACEGLKQYLGTQSEVDIEELSSSFSLFRNGADELYFRRMPCEASAPIYDCVDLRNTPILIVEWVLGNGDLLKNVDISVYLKGTQPEMIEDMQCNPFTAMILKLERQMLHKQLHKAKIIV